MVGIYTAGNRNLLTGGIYKLKRRKETVIYQAAFSSQLLKSSTKAEKF